jgi:predicted dehydrogenase
MTGRQGIALIGCGWAGRRHADAFVAEGAQLRWVIDPDPGRASALASLQEGARTATSPEAALSDPAVRAVDVCVPHHLHAEMCQAAIDAGKDVLCEKPLAGNLADADRLAAEAERAGVLLMVAENECYDPMYMRLQQLIQEGVIGSPAVVQATRECYLRDSFMNERPWFLSREESQGGILLSGGIHDFAKLRLVVGEINLVHVLRAPQRFRELETEDTVVMVLGFEGGAVGTLVESFCMLGPVTMTGAEVHRLRIDGGDGSIEITSTRRARVSTLDGTREVTVPANDTFREEIHEFLECTETRREPKTSARAQRRNLELVGAAYASMSSGAPQRL